MSSGTSGPRDDLALAAFAGLLARQIARLDIDDPARCLVLFRSNRDAGFVLFAGMILDALARRLL